ncbi:MAG: glycine--tRNA ligase subunit beta, partial [Paracoccaceae bacterium]|nr:glycine--tRNA ligase subunit beta [Paracoccaceae bacterium]
TPDHGATILAGNARVLIARLADARFFWENDLRKSLEDMSAPLENVVFHAKLGTQAERIERIAALAREIAPKVGADPDVAEQAARVVKADLASEMVYEFPELQGVMGGYYAKAAGLPDEVANACEAHYRPLGPSDDVPSEPVSIAVALADKIDMLTGFWAIDEKPTGSKDPFALRRASLGVIRILLTHGLRINLAPLIDRQSLKHEIRDNLDTAEERRLFILHHLLDEIADHGVFGAALHAVVEKLQGDGEEIEVGEGSWLDRLRASIPAQRDDLLSFLADRLKVALRDQGIRHDVIQACFDLGGQDDLVLLVNRVKALQEFLGTEDGANLLTGYRRASNIVAAEEKKDGVEYSGTPEDKFAEEDEERALFAALDAGEPAVAEALAGEDFAAAMAGMAKLRPAIDAFFDHVTVNAENQIVRRNRLCLLNRIRGVMRQVAIWEAIEGS